MILQALCDYYHRSEGLPPLGFASEDIDYIVVISKNGEFLYVEPRDDPQYRVIRGADKTSNVVANVLWDKASYILNINKKSKTIQEELSEECKSMVEIVKELAHNYPSNMEFQAVLQFYQKEEYKKAPQKEYWDKLCKGDSLVSFMVKGECRIVAQQCNDLEDYVHKRMLGNTTNKICLLTGEQGPVANITAMTPIPGSGSGKIVSFQKGQGYDSYGHVQGENAPISVEAEFAYTTALKHLLRAGSPNKMRIGNRTFLFWSSLRTEAAQKKEHGIYALLGMPNKYKDNPNHGVEQFGEIVKSLFSGNEAHFSKEDKFYFLSLEPATKGRIAVVYWRESTIEELIQNIKEHFSQMHIIDNRPYFKPYNGIYDMLCAVIKVESKDGNASKNEKIGKQYPRLSEDLLRSIIENKPYPYLLFTACLHRIQAEQDIPSREKDKKAYWAFSDKEITRAAIIKAYLNRLNSNNKKIEIMIDKENSNIGYLCGRLFAVLEKIQELSNSEDGYKTTIRKRYMNGASATPSVVFPTLLNLSNHHIEKMNGPIMYEKLKGEIFDKIKTFPDSLDLKKQGNFFIGYYHQRQAFYTKNGEQQERIESNNNQE